MEIIVIYYIFVPVFSKLETLNKLVTSFFGIFAAKTILFFLNQSSNFSYSTSNLKFILPVKTIYFIRHGQTDYNKQGIVQGGGVDSDLNELGRLQAAAFFEMYQSVPFKKIYTSALKRTHQSVKGFIEKEIPWEILPGLNEISWGSREGQKITPEEDVYYHWVLDQWRNGNDTLRIEGGESPEDVQKRQIPALQHIAGQVNEDNVLVCMHGRAMRVLLCTILNYPLKKMDDFEHENLCLYKVIHTDSMFRIELFNDTTHLQSLKNLQHI